MNHKEKVILKKLLESHEGLLSPASFINGIAGHDRRAVEHLVSMGYVDEVPQDVPGIVAGTTKSINFYRASEKGINQFAVWHKRLWFNFKDNTTLYLAISSIIFGLISSIASFYTIQNSIILQRTSELNFEPWVMFYAELNEDGTTKRPFPHIFLSNVGEINATQLSVVLRFYNYNNVEEIIAFSPTKHSFIQEFNIGVLSPLEDKVVSLKGEEVLEVIERPTGVNEEKILVVEVSYRRDADKKEFSKKHLYFKNGERWSLISRDENVYFKIINAIEKYKKDEYSYWWGLTSK